MISQATSTSHPPIAAICKLLVLLWASCAFASSHAEEVRTAAETVEWKSGASSEAELHQAVILKTYPMGITKYELDHATQVTGWQVADRWYFGRARGEDSGLALIWQVKASQQMSLSSDGVRFTHRF